MIALLLDQGIAPRTATILRGSEIDAIHVSEIGMDQALDLDILELARNQNRACVTLDHDFHTHLALAGHGKPSVVLLRIEGLGAADQARLIQTICSECKTALSEGAAVSADGHSIRIRRLPLR